jgi:predicted NBD/HSP70 family sugar kinase
MYLGIDVGGTKTLFAVFNSEGQVLAEHKIKTPKDYQQFKAECAAAISGELAKHQFSWACWAFPGLLDLKNGIGVAFGNENWRDVPLREDLAVMLPGTKVLMHNDAKLGGLSEAQLLKDKYHKVIYLTISTGIGGGVIINGVIDPAFEMFEPGSMQFEHDGRLQKWEDFASGKALFNRYGKLASEIEDDTIWKEFSGLIALGLEELLATVQPDVVVFGGGVGAHFEKFKDFLEEDLNAIKNPMVPVPPLLKAQRPEEAVIYGCYDYIKQNIE